MQAQCHVVSSFEGDERGAFRNQIYQIGERMRWWPVGHPKWSSWRDGGVLVSDDGSRVEECCYAECPKCGDGLYAVLRFDDLRPVDILDTGRAVKWPPDYPR